MIPESLWGVIPLPDTDPMPLDEEETAQLKLVRHLEKRIDLHGEEMRELVDKTIDRVLEHMPDAFKKAIVEASWALLEDEKFRGRVGKAVVDYGRRAVKESVGGFFLSRWTAVIAIVLVVATYVGWPATFKMIFHMFGRGPSGE